MAPRWLEDLRARTTPGQRRVVSALALVSGVWLVSSQLKGNVAREVEVRVPLAAAAAAGPVRGVRVSFHRGDEVIREVAQRWDVAPAEMVARVSLPEGPCEASVTVERAARLSSRASRVEVRADDPLVLAAPVE